MARRASSRPASTAAGAAFAALMAGVTLNALVWQKARHPAPLFDAPVAAASAAGLPATAEAPAAAAGVDRAPTGTLPSGTDAGSPPARAAAAPADAVAPRPDEPAPRAANDDDAAPKPASKKHQRSSRHGKAATKKAKGHDKISQFLGSESKSESRRRHRAKQDD